MYGCFHSDEMTDCLDLFFLRWRKTKSPIATSIASPPIPTPTPSPIPAPVEREDDLEVSELGSVKIEEVVELVGESMVCEAIEVVDAGCAGEMVDETGDNVLVVNKLESEDRSWIEIGCAHMVIVPET